MGDSLFLYAAGLLILAGGGIAAFLFFWLKRRFQIRRSLNLRLLLVRLPLAEVKENDPGGVERLREKISVMEQFYASLAALQGGWFSPRPWMALEMTVPAKDVELSFYAAVPRKNAGAVEKLIHAYYPDASIEPSEDYNIFTPQGKVAASVGRLRSGFLPAKTYRNLETDPLKAFTSVFTKLDEGTEGAALQLVFRAAAPKWRRNLLKRARSYYTGKRAPSGGEMFEELVKGPEERNREARVIPIDENRGKALEEKAGKPLFEANLRLIATAPAEERALVILSGLEQAFLQLDDPNLNGFKFARVKPKRIPGEVFRYSFRLFVPGEASILSAAELTSIFHFPNTAIEVPGIQTLKARESAPPSDISKSGLLLGYNLFRGVETKIYLGREDRRRHLYMIGQTGTGKSNFLKNLIRQDIEAGEGVSVIDPHGELAEYALSVIPDSRLDDVIYFDPGDTARPMGLNMLEYDPQFPQQKSLVVNELLEIFNKLFNMSVAGGPAFEQYFRNATQLVMDDPQSGNTLIEVARVFKDKAFRELKISRSTNPLVKSFWTQIAEKASGEQSLQNYAPYVTNKFDAFLSDDIMRPIVAQPVSAFNFREVMDQKKILLINLSKGKLGELNSSLLGLILVGKLLLAALTRVDVRDESKRQDFYLYIDEFHNVTTKSIATILSEARKYRLNLTVTHQYIKQLEEPIKDAVLGNVGSMMAFRIGTDDAELMEKQFAPEFSQRDLLSLDNARAYIKLLVGGKSSRPFSIRTYLAPEADLSRGDRIKELSRMKYGRPREFVEKEINERQLITV